MSSRFPAVIMLAAVAASWTGAAAKSVPAAIALTRALDRPVDIDCVAAALASIPHLESLARSDSPELYVASPNESRSDTLSYRGPGYVGTLSFSPSFLGTTTYFRHAAALPAGAPSPPAVARIRAFMRRIDRTLAARCAVPALAQPREHCVNVACPPG